MVEGFSDTGNRCFPSNIARAGQLKHDELRVRSTGSTTTSRLSDNSKGTRSLPPKRQKIKPGLAYSWCGPVEAIYASGLPL